ncbi:uncharacterized protein LOC135432623 [Drosophila montana]|uniref:uncharacterized protein LOC135432623 n=1 Tax=Drosophila montana TaxID=40370 RepID=UPI00313B9B5C
MAPRKRKGASSASVVGAGGDGPTCAKRPKLEQLQQVELMDLPLGPLHLIISKIDPDKQHILRHASNQLKVEHSDCMLHSYKSFANFHLRQQNGNDDQNMRHFVMQVLAQSTDYFINSGYDAIFTGKLMQFYKQLTTGEEDIDVTQMHQFLHEFYHNLEWTPAEWPKGAAARIRLNQRRLVQTMTLLNLLRQFRKFRVVSSAMNLMHWQLQLEVLGVHFGFREKETIASEEEKLIDFLTIIAELLVFDKSKSNVSRFIEIGNSVYVYGLKEQTLSARCPKLNLKFSVLAPVALRGQLEDVINGKVDMTKAVRCPLVDTFSIQLEVKSRQVNLWGGNSRMEICIVPLH